MNGKAMRKELDPVADDIAMFLSGIDGFPHDLRDFSAVEARTWMGVAGFKMPSHLLPHSFDKHINNMLRHNFCDPGIRGIHGSPGAFVLGFRGFLVVQGMVQPLVETGSTGSHGSGQVPILTGSAGGEDILFIPFILFIFRVLNSPLLSAMRAWRIATEVIPVSASIARFDDIVVLVRTFGTWRRFIRGIILIAVAGDAGFLFDRFPLIFTCLTGLPRHLGFSPLCFFPLHHLHLYQLVGIEGVAGKSGSESTLLAGGLHQQGITEFAEGAPPCILACRGVRRLRGFRGFKVAKVHVTTGAGFRGFGEVAVCAGPTIWFVGHFLLICFLMVSITHRVNRTRMHRVIPIHARMSVILTNIVVVMVNVFAGI
jgi:hypothetical protein